MKYFSSLSLLLLLTGCLTQNPVIELAPSVPFSLTVTPTSPSNDTTPTVSGVTDPSVTVSLFSGPGCSGSVLAAGYASSGGQFSLTSGELPTGSYNFSVRATNARGATCSSASIAYNLTATPPVVKVTKDSLSPALIKSTDTVNYIVEYTDADHVSLTSEGVLLSRTGTVECGSVTVTDGTTSTPHVAVTGCTGDGTLGISIAEGTATNLAGSSLSSNVSSMVTVDNTGISTVTFDPPAGTYTTMPSSIVITFPEAVNGFDGNDISAGGTCSIKPIISIVEKTSLTATINLTAPTCALGETVELNLDLTGTTDSAGNIGVGQLQEIYVIDTVGPTSATFLPEASRIKAIPGTIEVTFNEEIDPDSLTLGAFSVSGCGVTPPGLSLGTVSSDKAQIILTGGTCVNDETLELTVDFSTVKDTMGSLGTGSESVIYTYDTVGPDATSVAPATVTVAGVSDPMTVTVSFDEEVLLSSVAALTDLTISGTCGSLPTAVLTSTVSGTDISFELIGASCSHGQTLTVSLDGTSITDSAGNPGTGSASATYTVDTTGPSVASVLPVSGVVSSVPASVTFTFSEVLDPLSVDIGDFNVAGSCGTPPNLSLGVVSGTDVEIILSGATCAEATTVVLTAVTSGIKDSYGNDGTTSSGVTYTLASPGPVVGAFSPGDQLGIPAGLLSVSFNEPVKQDSVDPADFDVSASTCTGVLISNTVVVGSDITFNLAATCNPGDTVVITINGEDVTDPADNAGSGTATVTYTN